MALQFPSYTKTKTNQKKKPTTLKRRKISGSIYLATLIVRKREFLWMAGGDLDTLSFTGILAVAPGMSAFSTQYPGSKCVIRNCVLCRDRCHRCKRSYQKGSTNVNMTGTKERDDAE